MSDKIFKITLPAGDIRPATKEEFKNAGTTSYHGHILDALVSGFPEHKARYVHVKADKDGNLYLAVIDE